MNSTDSPSPSAPDRVDEYIELLSQTESGLRLYIISMVPIIADAEDIMQDTKMTIWKDFSKYESGSHFGAWARKIAFNRIIAFRKKKAIEKKKLVFSEEFYEVVDQHSIADDSSVSERISSLLKCVGQLQSSHHQAILMRYQNGLSIEEVSEKLGRTVTATYRMVSRIRATLKDCVQLQEQTT